jgi:hypothetical protein
MCRRLFLYAIAALTLTVTGGACGSSTTKTAAGSSSAATRPTDMTKEQAATAYLAALPPYRAALFAFDNTVGEVLGSPRANKSVAIASGTRFVAPRGSARDIRHAELVVVGTYAPAGEMSVSSRRRRHPDPAHGGPETVIPRRPT